MCVGVNFVFDFGFGTYFGYCIVSEDVTLQMKL